MSKNTEKTPKLTQKRSNQIVKKPKVIAPDARVRKKPKYKSFRLHKRVKHPAPNLPSWWKITKKSFKLLGANKKPIAWFFLIYGLLYLIFVRGVVSPLDIESVRSEFELLGSTSTIVNNVTITGLLIGSTVSAAGDISGLYQMLFLVTSALALIWLFRQQQAGHRVSLKDAYYRGMYPLVPFVLVLFVVALQTIPASIGNFLFTSVTSAGLAVTVLEQILWLLLLITTLLLSFYLISSSLIALFVVTLPDMTPMLALKKAKEMVVFRRLSVLRKVLALVFVVIAIYVLTVFPSIFISAALAQLVFFIITIFAVPFSVAYLFVLYRELL